MHPLPPYGVAIRTAIASSQLEEMKRVEAVAEQYLVEHGDLSAALEALKIEIAKREKAG